MPTIYDIIPSLIYLNIGVIVSITIFIITQVLVFRSKFNESKERIFRACNTLKVEVDELDKWYKSDEYNILKIRHYITNQNLGYIQKKNEYSGNIINTAIYDGIVNSGLITYLKEDTQSKLNTYFFYAVLHNKRMYNLSQIYDDKASSPEFKFENIKALTDSLAWDINEIDLTKHEKEMQKLMPKLKELLDKEIEDAEEKKWYHRNP